MDRNDYYRYIIQGLLSINAQRENIKSSLVCKIRGTVRKLGKNIYIPNYCYHYLITTAIILISLNPVDIVFFPVFVCRYRRKISAASLTC